MSIGVKKIKILFLLLIVLFCFQAFPFLSGYRLSSDDVWFDTLLFQGWSNLWTNAKYVAFSQGRFGHFLLMPSLMVSAHYADNYIFRLCYTALYFFNFILFGIYTSFFLFRKNSFYFMMFFSLCLLSFHPLDYYYLPPTAYPLEVALPVFLILFSRINIIKLRSDDFVRHNEGRVKFIYFLILFVGICFFEFCFSFYIALFFSEFVTDFLKDMSSKGAIENIKKRVNAYWCDFLVIFLYLAIYISFRMSFPSRYDGNTLGTIFSVSLIIKTILGHALGGTIFLSALRYKKELLPFISHLKIEDYLCIVTVFFASFYLFYKALEQVNRIKLHKFDFFKLFILGFSVILYTTLPMALVHKYQSWCSSLKHCTYVDSRLAFLGVIILLSSLFLFKLTKRRILILSFVLSCFSITSFYVNIIVADDMSKYVMGWERAKNFECVSQEMPPGTPLSVIMDPEKRIPFVEEFHFDMDKYWNDHILKNKKEKLCHFSHSYDFEVPKISANMSIPFTKGSAYLFFLRDGWFPAAKWGIWSQASGARIQFSKLPRDVHNIIVDCGIMGTHVNSTRHVKVLINNFEEKFTLTNIDSNILNIKVPYILGGNKEDEINMQIIVEDPQSPKELGVGIDGRNFGILLKSIEFR